MNVRREPSGLTTGLVFIAGLLAANTQCWSVAGAGQAVSATTVVAGAAVAGPAVEIQTGDVTRFYQVYETASGHPAADRLQRDYIDPGTSGLHDFFQLRQTTAARIAEAIDKQPQLYSGARRCVDALPAARRRLQAAVGRLLRLYPEAKLPPVTIVIGRGRPIGIGSPATGLQIGLEALCGVSWADPGPEDRFVHIIAHEYVHVQQRRELVDDDNPTVLEASLVEGAAEFVGELISGGVSYARQAATYRGREQEIDARFVTDMDSRDLSNWLYNGSMDQPGDIGYWVGYRINQAYYNRAADKQAAIRQIIGMQDPKAFLAASGWRPGLPSAPAPGR